MEKLPHFKLKGGPEDIGFQHGRLLKDRVQACYKYYTETLFDSEKIDLKHYGEQYLNLIGGHFPDYETEIRALASGADMAPWQIAVINARTEIHLLGVMDKIANECTALYFKNDRIIGENWDWMRELEDIMALLEIERPDGHKILMLAEPGIIGKVGFNSAGLGVCLNIIHGPGFQLGIPIHILLRAALDATSIQEARKRIRTCPFWTYSNILLGDDNGRSACLELDGGQMKEVDYGADLPVHTNHFIVDGHNEEEDPLFKNSILRLNRAKDIFSERSLPDMEMIKTILLDSEHGGDAICSPYKKILHFEIGTVCSVIMDLPGRTMHITPGNPLDNSFREYHI
ncbi:MAG: C45 family autoproteolytic acyltransferase/hydrolase [Acidobacteriota bacterium]|nr:C45 family autoproteolytic acyltransferase/hydrolase [Acidobacteriota bacterium]